MPKTWFKMQANDSGEARIDIYDKIGFWGIRAVDFIGNLRALGDVQTINVHINSPGGEVFDALAIHNNLKRHTATVNVYVDGLAASAASLVAMAGDQVIMPENAMMMIHNPMGLVMGNADEMRDFADVLDKIASALISAYAAKSGADDGDIKKMLDAETWLTAKEAVEMGFADVLEAEMKIAARFDLSRYHDAPKAFHITNPKEDAMSRKPKAEGAPPATEPENQTTPDPVADPAPEPTASEPQPGPTPEPVAEPEPIAAKAADPVVVAEMCNEAGVSSMSAMLIKAKLPLDVIEARVETAKEVKDLFARAAKMNPTIDASLADTLNADGISVESAKAIVGNMLATNQSPEISNSRGVNGSSDHGWGDVIAKVTPKHLKARAERASK